MIGIVAIGGIRIAAALEAGLYTIGSAIRSMASAAQPLMARAGTEAFKATESALSVTGRGLNRTATEIRGAMQRAFLSGEERHKQALQGIYNEGFFYHYGSIGTSGRAINERAVIVETDDGQQELIFDQTGGIEVSYSEASGIRRDYQTASKYAEIRAEADDASSGVLAGIIATLETEYYRATDERFDELIAMWERAV